jgi:hypothetical protein
VSDEESSRITIYVNLKMLALVTAYASIISGYLTAPLVLAMLLLITLVTLGWKCHMTSKRVEAKIDKLIKENNNRNLYN